MENPWSSPWVTDDDPHKEAAPEPAASLAFPPAVKFDIADPSSLWPQDDGFGVWGGGGGRASGDVGESGGNEAEEVGNGGFMTSAGLDPAGVEPLPSPSVEADPWAEVISPVAAEEPEKDVFAEESVLEQNAPEGTALTNEPGSAIPNPLISPEPPVSPVRAIDTSVDERASPSPEPASPDIAPGRGADAVALTVLKHRDHPSPVPEGGPRQVSKVQELVDMYDGIAKKASEAAVEHDPLKEARCTGPPRVDEPGADADAWEEFESGDPQPPDDTAAPAQPAVVPIPAASPKPSPEPIKFQIDDVAIATLFDSLADPPTTLPADIPDRLAPLDAFTLTERKAWYRLSRQGSPRLHDAGDPDNYTRATWQGSAVSAETFVVVRRWMQEGAVLVGGRMRAGGVRGSAATFGWEASSSSDPVDLSFLRKRSAEGTRPRSESAAASPNPGGAAGSANNWAGNANARPLSVPAPPEGFSLTPTVPMVGSKTTKPSPLVFATSQESAPLESDSDEEWGDMVTSPQATGTFGAASDSRADSAVSFGKPGSGSSLDSRQVQASNPQPSKPVGYRETGASTSAPGPILSPTKLEPSAVKEAHPAPRSVASAQIQAREEAAVREVILRLPDLSYMLR